MRKLAALVSSVLLCFGLMAVFQPSSAIGQPFPKAKGKADAKKKGGPGGELKKAYDLLRRLRADDGTSGRSEERLREWTDRAAGLYRDGLKALNAGEPARAREYGLAAHDLGRAVDHARNGARFDRLDPDLPPPSDDFGLEDTRERARHDLRRAYERIQELGAWQGPAGIDYYEKAARDLYGAARRDLEAGRDERGGELARASEAMTHVPEHIAHASEERGRIEPRRAPERPEPKEKRAEPRDRDDLGLPPELPPGA